MRRYRKRSQFFNLLLSYGDREQRTRRGEGDSSLLVQQLEGRPPSQTMFQVDSSTMVYKEVAVYSDTRMKATMSSS